MTDHNSKKTSRRLQKSLTIDLPDLLPHTADETEKIGGTRTSRRTKDTECLTGSGDDRKKCKKGQQVTFENDQITLKYAFDDLIGSQLSHNTDREFNDDATLNTLNEETIDVKGAKKERSPLESLKKSINFENQQQEQQQNRPKSRHKRLQHQHSIAESPDSSKNLQASKPILLKNITKQHSLSTMRSRSQRVSQAVTCSPTSDDVTFNNWKLTYKDFIPDKDAVERFSALMEEANDWLKQNPHVKVTTCETITCVFSDCYWPINFESTLLSKRVSSNSANHNVRGLRIWLVPNNLTALQQQQKQQQQRHQTITYQDFLPQLNDNIDSLINCVNCSLDDNTLKGQILCMQTLDVPVVDGRLDTDESFWTEYSDQSITKACILRVYLIKELNGKVYGCEKILVGVKDFIPLKTNRDEYETFEKLVDRSNEWVNHVNCRKKKKKSSPEEEEVEEELEKKQKMKGIEATFEKIPPLVILNVQSLLVHTHQDLDRIPGHDCFSTMPCLNKSQQTEMLRILRVFFILPIGVLLKTPPQQTPISSHSFFPFLKQQCKTSRAESRRLSSKKGREASKKKKAKMETLKELLLKANEFLLETDLTEEIINVETIISPFTQSFSSPPDEDDNDDDDDQLKYLFVLRLYVANQRKGAGRNGPSKFNSQHSKSNDEESTDDTGNKVLLAPGSNKGTENGGPHPGPIFLSHVVNRNFRYRWLVAGTTFVFCMSVIVIVSVVYSNAA